MKIFGLIAAFIIIALIDIPFILKKTTGKARYLTAYSVVFILGFSVSLLQLIKKAPISPAKVIESIIKGIVGGVNE